jgi:Bacterial membrane protein YfhO
MKPSGKPGPSELGLRWFPTVVFVLTTFLWLPLPLLGIRTFAGVDLIETGAPYRDSLDRPPEVVSPIQTDQVELLPGPITFFRELREGHLQLWDPNVAGGTPTGVLPLMGIYSPFSVGYLVLPAWYAVGLKVALTLLFCQGFMYLLMRRLGAGVVPATLAAVAYTFLGANLVMVHRMSAPMVLPALLWGLHRLADQPGLRRAGVVALFTTWLWLEGFPAAFAYSMYVSAAWAVWLIVRRAAALARTAGRDGGLRFALRGGLAAGFGVIWGLVLSSFTLIPFVAEVTSRGVLDQRAYTSATHLPSIQAAGILDLEAIGTYPAGVFWSGLNPVESVTNLGLIVSIAVAAGLIAAASGRLRVRAAGREAWSFFCGLGIVGVVLVFVGTPLLGLAYLLPGIAHNPIGRARFVIGLAGAVLAGLALDAWWRRPGGAERIPSARGISIIGLVVVGILITAVGPKYLDAARDAGQLGEVVLGVLANSALALVALGSASLCRRRAPGRLVMVSGFVIAGLLYLQLAHPLRDFTPDAPVEDFYSRQAGHAEIGRHLRGGYRFAATELRNFYPNSSQVFGMPDLRGLALHSREFVSLIEAVNPVAFERDPLKVILARDEWNLASPILDDLGVRVFALGTDEMPLGLIQEEDRGPYRWVDVSALPAPARTFSAPGSVAGLILPLRGEGVCSSDHVAVSLLAHGSTLDVSRRPGHDLNGSWLPFALTGDGLVRGEPYEVRIATGPSCRLQAGARGEGGTLTLASRLITPDPTSPVRLVATEQAWIYERESAWPLVSSHARWRAFADQRRLLEYAAFRGPEEIDVASFVGTGPPQQPGAVPATIFDVELRDESVALGTDGDTTSLVVVSQNAADGWRVSIDGEEAEIVLVDGALMGSFVPPGQHRVEFSYQPSHFAAGSAISLAALVLTIACGAAWFAIDRRRSAATALRRDGQ